jgi:hypothetical protein
MILRMLTKIVVETIMMMMMDGSGEHGTTTVFRESN